MWKLYVYRRFCLLRGVINVSYVDLSQRSSTLVIENNDRRVLHETLSEGEKCKRGVTLTLTNMYRLPLTSRTQSIGSCFPGRCARHKLLRISSWVHILCKKCPSLFEYYHIQQYYECWRRSSWRRDVKFDEVSVSVQIQ